MRLALSVRKTASRLRTQARETSLEKRLRALDDELAHVATRLLAAPGLEEPLRKLLDAPPSFLPAKVRELQAARAELSDPYDRLAFDLGLLDDEGRACHLLASLDPALEKRAALVLVHICHLANEKRWRRFVPENFNPYGAPDQIAVAFLRLEAAGSVELTWTLRCAEGHDLENFRTSALSLLGRAYRTRTCTRCPEGERELSVRVSASLP